ncbi:MAG: glycosyltransferase [Hyphomicrobiales bacterium]|nr:glycosyltransferase [Hyphomicrobiales bacterium]MCP5372211.1 glycosyltransferase [Hyphomicrobiales bacterium]
MKDVTVGIKAFIRTAELDAALASLAGKGFAQVVVADDSHMDDARRALYARHADRLPLRVLELPFDSGLSYGRNRLVEACATPYFLLMDDDMELTGDLGLLRRVLDSDPALGGAAGMWADHVGGPAYSNTGNLFVFDRCVVQDIGFARRAGRVERPGVPPYHVTDMITNLALFDMRVFDDALWDPAYKITREHEDFYLTHKARGRWKFATVPDFVCVHRPPSASAQASGYRAYRTRDETRARADAHFRAKWNKPDGLVWGLPLKPKRFSKAQHLRHVQLALNPVFRFFK